MTIDRAMNGPQRLTVAAVEDLLDSMHHADLTLRVNGEDRHFQADLIRQLITAYTLLEQAIEMNGEDAFWQHLGRLPVTKFFGPLREQMMEAGRT